MRPRPRQPQTRRPRCHRSATGLVQPLQRGSPAPRPRLSLSPRVQCSLNPRRPVSRSRGLLHPSVRFSTPDDAMSGNAPPIGAMAKLTVWHDGACPLCRREIALMRQLDRRGTIEFIDVVGRRRRRARSTGPLCWRAFMPARMVDCCQGRRRSRLCGAPRRCCDRWGWQRVRRGCWQGSSGSMSRSCASGRAFSASWLIANVARSCETVRELLVDEQRNQRADRARQQIAARCHQPELACQEQRD